MAKKKALGRGLAAILNDADKKVERKNLRPKKEKNIIDHIDIERIEKNPFQPRVKFDEIELKELASSIIELGIVQPITVRKLNKNKYQLISGERRLRASKIAGLKKIPAFIKNANEEQMLEIAIVENIQRKDLNPIEIALSFKRLIDECKLTQEECSKKLGKNRTTITNFLRLLKLPKEIQIGLQERKISTGHARALITMNNIENQLNIYAEIVENGLSVREVEQLSKTFSGKPYKKIPKKEKILFIPESIPFAQQKDIHVLSKKIGKQLKIERDKKGKGFLGFEFSSDKELEDLLKQLIS